MHFTLKQTALTLWVLFYTIQVHAQTANTRVTSRDSLLIISPNPAKGFYHEYLLFIPKGVPLQQTTYLLVEPNNTGKLSDSMPLHRAYAIDLAAVSSVGNNVSTELKVPLLVPVFPRPASQPLTYTHALDRDVMLEQQPALKRLDLQLLQMIGDARGVLSALGIQVQEKVLMTGFSASASFINRFSLIHPERIKALAIGGFNGELMFPQGELDGVKLNYPLGTYDFERLFGKKFDMQAFRNLPQYVYMGELDENDAVQFDDAYSAEERAVINGHIGATVAQRYLACQRVYQQQGMKATFKTYERIGHWTTGNMNLTVMLFFKEQMSRP